MKKKRQKSELHVSMKIYSKRLKSRIEKKNTGGYGVIICSSSSETHCISYYWPLEIMITCHMEQKFNVVVDANFILKSLKCLQSHIQGHLS